MRPLKYKIKLSESKKEELEKIISKQTTAQNIAKRARIILMAHSGKHTNRDEIAKYVGITENELTKWTKRWVNNKDKNIEKILEDKPRSGRPATITAE